MSDEQKESSEQEAPGADDSAAVQAALKGIPGLAAAVGNKPASDEPGMPDLLDGSEGEEPSFGTSKKPVEDSETVQKALRQLGLQ